MNKFKFNKHLCTVERSDYKSAVELEEKMRKNGITPGQDFQRVFTTFTSNLNTASNEMMLNKYETEEKHNIIQ